MAIIPTPSTDESAGLVYTRVSIELHPLETGNIAN